MTASQQPGRPSWIADELYPFADHQVAVNGASVHYVDEGQGPPLLLLHGNPTWSFVYREIILGLRDRYRCIAPDYPGFGLSRAAPDYGFTPAEHAGVIEQWLLTLDLTNVTMMVQDWGGPIGFAVATRHPERFAGFVIGNTWAWPKSDPGTQLFSRILGGPVGRRLILHRNVFVEKIIPSGVRRRKLSPAVMEAYRGPFPTPQSRRPTYVFPREILVSRPFLAEIARRLPTVTDRPALLTWPTADVAFRDASASAGSTSSPTTERWCSKARATTSRKTRLTRSSRPSAPGRTPRAPDR